MNFVSCLPAQDCVLQFLMSLPDPEQFPPFRSVLVLVRNLVWVPPPQGFEQDNQVDQDPQTQSIGSSVDVGSIGSSAVVVSVC